MENKNRGGAVWVFAEPKGGSLQAVSLQLVGKARILADRLNVDVEAVLIGHNLSKASELLIASGADTVYLADSEELAMYRSDMYSRIIVHLAEEKQPEVFLIGSTFIGRELAPILAARLETGLTAHCIELVIGQDNVLDQQIPAYGGLISILCPERRPQMATVAAGVFPTPEPDQLRTGRIVELPATVSADPRIRTVEIVREESEAESLDAAQFIVAGGAGAGDADGWQQIRDLSNLLNAPLGCTRPVVDEGWAELETMIGQSGKMVNPRFYLGIGLSGELQHMVGIKGAQMMIAINNDPKSPVFDQVDYGIVEECRAFIPLLIEKIKALS